MRRLALFLFLACAASAAQAPTTAGLADALARDLSQGDAEAFLSHFDAKLPERARLERHLYALVNLGDVGTSIEISSDEGNERQRKLEFDWILELSTGRRRATVHCTIERHGKQWIITALDPIDFFEPPKS